MTIRHAYNALPIRIDSVECRSDVKKSDLHRDAHIIADALYDRLPSSTYEAMMARLREREAMADRDAEERQRRWREQMDESFGSQPNPNY